MSLQDNNNGWSAGILTTLASAALAWFGMLTHRTFSNAGRVDVMEAKIENLDTKFDKMDSKLDRLVYHLLDDKE